MALTVPTAQSPDLATVEISIGGSPMPPSAQIFEIVVASAVNRLPWARITLRDGSTSENTFAGSSDPTFTPGAEVEIQMGYHRTHEPVFRGLLVKHAIVAQQGRPSQLVLECRHAAVRSTLAPRSRAFKEMTDSAIAEQILGDYSLTSNVTATEVTHAQLVQWKATDWDFLLLRARANGQLVVAGLDEVTIAAPDVSATPALSLLYGASLDEFEGTIDARHQIGSSLARAWDSASQETRETPAGSVDEPEAGSDLPADLATAMGDPEILFDHPADLSDGELQSWADARLLRSRSAKIRARARARGNTNALPGEMLELDGLGDRFNGPVFIAGVRHNWVRGRWRTDYELGLNPDWLAFADEEGGGGGLLPRLCGLHVGVVQALEDPDGVERVRVRLPVTLPEDDGLWARLATVEAGDQRGFVFRPEIGDEVMVGFLEDDPRHPVVLGALHSAAHPAPLPGSDDNHEKGYFSRSDMRVHFNDDTKVLTLSTPAGNKIVLSEEDQGITLEDQNGNRLVMSPEGITIESVQALETSSSTDTKLEAGASLSAKASAALTVEGSASAALKSSGQTEVKGSLVRIN